MRFPTRNQRMEKPGQRNIHKVSPGSNFFTKFVDSEVPGLKDIVAVHITEEVVQIGFKRSQVDLSVGRGLFIQGKVEVGSATKNRGIRQTGITSTINNAADVLHSFASNSVNRLEAMGAVRTQRAGFGAKATVLGQNTELTPLMGFQSRSTSGSQGNRNRNTTKAVSRIREEGSQQ